MANRAGFVHRVLTIARKDLRSELRTKETINASVSFSVVMLLLFSFAVDPGAEAAREIAAGLLWLVFAFASALVLNRSFARELSNDCLDALLSSPAESAEIYLGKCLTNFVLLLMVELVCIPVFGLFYNVDLPVGWPLLIGVLLLGTWALTAIGTMFSAMTVNLRLRELMLPILVYPMMIPALIAAIRLTTVVLLGEPLGENWIWFKLLIVFDVIFTLLAFALVDVVLVG